MSHDKELQPTSSPLQRWGKAQLRPLSLEYLVTIFICWFLAERLAGQDPTARLIFWVKITYPWLPTSCAHYKLNMAFPTFCCCAIGKSHSHPLSCIFFLRNVGHFDVCNCIDLFKSSRTPLLSFPADCNTKKTGEAVCLVLLKTVSTFCLNDIHLRQL